jgi:thiamine biosynthesis lipoprotein
MRTSPPKIGRRGFVKIVGFSGLAAGVAIAAGRRGLRSSGLARLVETRLLMGTYVQLVLYADDQEAARNAADVALGRMRSLERVLSRHRDESALSSLNRCGTLDQPPAPLVDLLKFSRSISELTLGAFDLSIEPLARLVRQAAMEGATPAPERLSQAAHAVDYAAIEADEDRVRFLQDGMAITPDGVGKGFILDEGLRILTGMGFPHVMLDAGGDIVVSRGLAEPTWRVGIQDPRRPAGDLVAFATLSNGAIATSGDYLDAYTPDLTLNHILDPRTGASPRQLSSASVIAPTAAMADALSTGIMVLGPERGLQLVQTLPGVECLLIGKSGELVQSKGFPFTRPF